MLQAGAVLYLFLKISKAIFENFVHGTENIASQLSSCYRLKLKLSGSELHSQTHKRSAISNISLSKVAWAISFFGMVLLGTKRCCNTVSSRTKRVDSTLNGK